MALAGGAVGITGTGRGDGPANIVGHLITGAGPVGVKLATGRVPQ